MGAYVMITPLNLRPMGRSRMRPCRISFLPEHLSGSQWPRSHAAAISYTLYQHISLFLLLFLSFQCGKLVFCSGPLNGGFGSGSPSSPLLPPRGLLRYRSLPFEWLLWFFLTIFWRVCDFQMCEYIKLWWGCCLLERERERGLRVRSLGKGGDPGRGGIA